MEKCVGFQNIQIFFKNKFQTFNFYINNFFIKMAFLYFKEVC